MRFTIFPAHVSKVVCLPRKSDARSYEVLHLSHKIIVPKLKISCSKTQPLSGNQWPDLKSLMSMALVLRLPREIHLCRSSSNVPRPPSFLEMPQNPHVLLTFGRVENPLRLPRKMTLQRPKVARTCGALCILTQKCASRHNCVHFLNISTSKSVPKVRCFVHFDFEMCFAPQRRALFRHLNFQMWSDTEDPPEPQINGKTMFRDFRAPASSFFALFLFSDLLSSALLLSDSSHLCFSICPCCRTFDF